MIPLDQLNYLIADTRRITNGRWWRIIGVWFSSPFLAVLSYRFNRAMYLLFGRYWRIALVILTPIGFLLRPFFPRCEIHYLAEIGPGLIILHPSLGVVISGRVRAGCNLTLTGGNCIGYRKSGSPVIGSNVTFGVNASALGDIAIADGTQIGAGAILLVDTSANSVVVGVPAHPTRLSDEPVTLPDE